MRDTAHDLAHQPQRGLRSDLHHGHHLDLFLTLEPPACRSRTGTYTVGRNPPQTDHYDVFFFHDPAPTEIYTLSLHDALPIWLRTTRASARTFFTFRHYITPSARNF